MLRLAVGLVTIVALVAALAMTAVQPESWPVLLGAGVLALGVLAEHRRYRAGRREPVGPDWRPTAERFLDPETGEPLAVWFNPVSGARRYLPMSFAIERHPQ